VILRLTFYLARLSLNLTKRGGRFAPEQWPTLRRKGGRFAPERRPIYSGICNKADPDELMSRLDEDEKKIIKLLEQGYLQREIADKLGKSTAWVSKKITKMREKLRPFSKTMM
jgi:DNA-binding NarL/FixJ family response regulator